MPNRTRTLLLLALAVWFLARRRRPGVPGELPPPAPPQATPPPVDLLRMQISVFTRTGALSGQMVLEVQQGRFVRPGTEQPLPIRGGDMLEIQLWITNAQASPIPVRILAGVYGAEDGRLRAALWANGESAREIVAAANTTTTTALSTQITQADFGETSFEATLLVELRPEQGSTLRYAAERILQYVAASPTPSGGGETPPPGPPGGMLVARQVRSPRSPQTARL